MPLFFCSYPSTPLHKGMDSICSMQFIHSVTILMKFLVWSGPPAEKKDTEDLGKVKHSVARVILGMTVSTCGKLSASVLHSTKERKRGV